MTPEIYCSVKKRSSKYCYIHSSSSEEISDFLMHINLFCRWDFMFRAPFQRWNNLKKTIYPWIWETKEVAYSSQSVCQNTGHCSPPSQAEKWAGQIFCCDRTASSTPPCCPVYTKKSSNFLTHYSTVNLLCTRIFLLNSSIKKKQQDELAREGKKKDHTSTVWNSITATSHSARLSLAVGLLLFPAQQQMSELPLNYSRISHLDIILP